MNVAAILLRIIAVSVLTLIYCSVYLISLLRPAWRKRGFRRQDRILVIGTFHNPNWFQSHIVPLAKCRIGQVILVCDEPVFQLENVHYICPPKIANRLLTRAGAKFFYAVAASVRYRPDMYMGYHIFPGAISALVLGSIFNRPACYQDTSGPLELAGGGWKAENRLLVALGGPSKLVEWAVFTVVRRFDMIVVRGRSAKQYIEDIGCRNMLSIITGSIDVKGEWYNWDQRDIDLIFVGRLIKAKNPAVFLATVVELNRNIPNIRAVMIGEGPDMAELAGLCTEHGLNGQVELLGQRNDVMAWYQRAKVFVLPSAWEGVSIAMLEAMASGCVPVVSKVGDLGDLVVPGKNGYLIDEIKTESFSKHTARLLQDQAHWAEYSRQARLDAMNYSGLTAVADKWHHDLNRLIAGQSGKVRKLSDTEQEK
ncbi:MAG: glycosyltransferase [Gammaproteobacteria bacterium]|nr:glycosyltransferase [Gammaproteobacteria bacterium]MDH5652373.1 glycosyltransferase [Gammaproteobacteria bacterium]